MEGKILRPLPGEEVQSLLDINDECEECDVIPLKFDDEEVDDEEVENGENRENGENEIDD
jgi:hypothetical protein